MGHTAHYANPYEQIKLYCDQMQQVVDAFVIEPHNRFLDLRWLKAKTKMINGAAKVSSKLQGAVIFTSHRFDIEDLTKQFASEQRWFRFV